MKFRRGEQKIGSWWPKVPLRNRGWRKPVKPGVGLVDIGRLVWVV